MIRFLLSILVVAFTIVSPASADQQNGEQACLDQAAVAPLAQLSQVSCTSDYDCGYGNICEYNQCRPAQCITDNSCAPWENCEYGRCVSDPFAQRCSEDSDCRIGYRCWGGWCKRW